MAVEATLSAGVRAPALEMRGIVKEFPGVRALDDCSLTLADGEALALVGENGAGKSTMMKVLSGVYPFGSYAGQIFRSGAEVQFAGTAAAEQAGIAIIHQELNLFGELSVLENLFVGAYLTNRFGLMDWRAMAERAAPVMARLGVGFALSDKVKDLSVGDSQMVEIARALLKKARVLILDEPTSALSEREVARLYELIAELRREGVAFVYISHKLDEVFHLCDRVVVLRDGKTVGGGSLKALATEQLIALMVGRPLQDVYPPKRLVADAKGKAAVVLSVDGLSAVHRGLGHQLVKAVSFSARAGEILGIGGMMGSGRSELLYALFGHPDYLASGSVSIDRAVVPRNSIALSLKARLGLVTEDRKRTGLHLPLTIRENISMASLSRVAVLKGLIIDRRAEDRRAGDYMQRLRIKAPTYEEIVGNLSGGNQQKVVLAKWAAMHPKVLMIDEPTRGVDIGAKVEIYGLLHELAASGMTILVVSSEMPELVGLCGRVLVMRDGELAGELHGDSVTSENVLRLAVGG